MQPYHAQFAKGSRVFIQGPTTLVRFRDTWKLHHPMTAKMLPFAGRQALVESIGFYHGGDVLYTLSGIPGTWHEACLCLESPKASWPSFELDGARFSTLEEFYAEVSCVLVPESDWGHSLDAFDDILRGGFGTPEGGFTIRWIRHAISAERLGHTETVRQLELRLSRCHPTNRSSVAEHLARAQRGEGATVFDWLLEIIRRHGPGGSEQSDCVILELR